MTRRLLLLTAGVGAVLMSGVLSVSAGGTWLYTTESRYEPGDHVVAVGYVQDSTAASPFHAELGLIPMADISDYGSQSWQILVGVVTIENAGLHGYLANRVSFEFKVPASLGVGEYEIAGRNEKGEFFGDLVGLMLYVGYDPDFERWIEWPLNEPLIGDLAPDDVIAGPGWSVTVADLRDGEYPQQAADFMLPETFPNTATEKKPAETSMTTASPTTTIAELPATPTVDEQAQQIVAVPVVPLSASEPDITQRAILLLALIAGVVTVAVVYVVHFRSRSDG